MLRLKMKLKKLVCLFAIISVAVFMYIIFKPVTSKDFTLEQLDSSVYDLDKYTTPFWKGNIVYNECVYPIISPENEVQSFQLMYKASEIVSVKNYTLDKEYTEGVDYILEDGRLVILPTGNIELIKQEYIYRNERDESLVESEIYPFYPRKDSDGYIYWTEEEEFVLQTLAVTYIHNDKWNYDIPKSQLKKLKKIKNKLNNGENITVVIDGNSISMGANSSSKLKIEPFADDYVNMTHNYLKNKYGNENIEIINSAVGGSTAKFSEEKCDELIVQHNPDLVIMAFGMNEASSGRSAEIFKNNLINRITYTKEQLPDCEFLLVTSVYGNPVLFSQKLYEEHANAIYEIASEYDYVGVCDPQSIMGSLLEKKDYMCFMADNMVHPNDYGMRIIAQCVIAALTE